MKRYKEITFKQFQSAVKQAEAEPGFENWSPSLDVQCARAERTDFLCLGFRKDVSGGCRQARHVRTSLKVRGAELDTPDLKDFNAEAIVGVQIGHQGHKLWVCVDGISVLRVTSPLIQLEDMRDD